MLLLAESMCRKNQKELSERASAPYEAAARAVASVQQEGLRGVLVGFLVDSLISTGRFADARACVCFTLTDRRHWSLSGPSRNRKEGVDWPRWPGTGSQRKSRNNTGPCSTAA